jgi:hypothetical protein
MFNGVLIKKGIYGFSMRKKERPIIILDPFLKNSEYIRACPGENGASTVSMSSPEIKLKASGKLSIYTWSRNIVR